MKLKTFFASSAALAAVALIGPTLTAPGWSPVATARAANVSVNFSIFYDDLAPYGDWISYHGDYVFVPVIADRDWQPYREGHWIYARGIGWTWVSDEPFGWATYHYGRWGFDEEIGWYWKPGTRWAPAWVSWRRSGSYLAWAPLPPYRGYDDDISISVNIGSIPDYYWVAVPSRDFLAVNLNVVIINDDRERQRIVHDAEFVGSVKVENNIIVNNVIDINSVEKNTGKQVKEVEVKQTDDPASAKASAGEVAVFDGTVEPDKTAKPPKLREVSEVKENQHLTRKKMKAQSDEPAAINPDDQAAQSGEQQPDKKKLNVEQPEDQAADTQNNDQAATPDGKKKKKLEIEQTQSATPSDEMSVGSITKPDGKNAGKKKPASGDEPAAKKNKKAVPCDPAADPATQEGCAPQD